MLLLGGTPTSFSLSMAKQSWKSYNSPQPRRAHLTCKSFLLKGHSNCYLCILLVMAKQLCQVLHQQIQCNIFFSLLLSTTKLLMEHKPMLPTYVSHHIILNLLPAGFCISIYFFKLFSKDPRTSLCLVESKLTGLGYNQHIPCGCKYSNKHIIPDWR